MTSNFTLSFCSKTLDIDSKMSNKHYIYLDSITRRALFSKAHVTQYCTLFQNDICAENLAGATSQTKSRDERLAQSGHIPEY